jgi:hypothetical protein
MKITLPDKSSIDDRPLLEATTEGGVRLEIPYHENTWIVELSRADCEAIAEWIGYRRPGYFRPAADADS